jgi:hypothetical protein
MAVLGEEEWKAHSELIGRVTLSWNSCVLRLLHVFRHLTGLPIELAGEIFFSHRSDQGQRYLLRRVAAAVELEEAPREALETILRRLETVSTRRNLAAHTIFSMSLFDPESGAWGLKIVPAMPAGLNGKLDANFTAQFEKAERDLDAICRDLEEWILTSPYPRREWGLPALLGEPPPWFEADPTIPEPGETWPPPAF